jgi:hypothetical protein
LLADPADFAGMNQEYAKVFTVDPPVRAVAKLGVELPNLRVSERASIGVGWPIDGGAVALVPFVQLDGEHERYGEVQGALAVDGLTVG